MMTQWILESASLTRIKKFLDQYSFDARGYVEGYIDKLYDLLKGMRPRVEVSQTFT